MPNGIAMKPNDQIPHDVLLVVTCRTTNNRAVLRARFWPVGVSPMRTFAGRLKYARSGQSGCTTAKTSSGARPPLVFVEQSSVNLVIDSRLPRPSR
jgi:hypothetical protein